MNFWIGITDNDWFKFLSARSPDEVNFWLPGGGAFKALEPGEPFLFKLHSPLNYIVGGGFFVRHTLIPTSLAWEAFGEKNGVACFDDLLSKIRKYRGMKSFEPDPVIGCIILTNPFFFSEKQWIPAPNDFSKNIVRGKTYNTVNLSGNELWRQIELSLNDDVILTNPKAAEDTALYGSEYLTRARLGQGAFRILVTEAYSRRCAITGERTLPVLEAAHIKPYSQTGPNKISNGLLLRSDLHKLFDLGYLTITSDYSVEVSKRIKEEYENGREYYALQGKTLRNMPVNPAEYPSSDFIEWHNQNIYIP